MQVCTVLSNSKETISVYNWRQANGNTISRWTLFMFISVFRPRAVFLLRLEHFSPWGGEKTLPAGFLHSYNYVAQFATGRRRDQDGDAESLRLWLMLQVSVISDGLWEPAGMRIADLHTVASDMWCSHLKCIVLLALKKVIFTCQLFCELKIFFRRSLSSAVFAPLVLSQTFLSQLSAVFVAPRPDTTVEFRVERQPSQSQTFLCWRVRVSTKMCCQSKNSEKYSYVPQVEPRLWLVSTKLANVVKRWKLKSCLYVICRGFPKKAWW